MAELGRLFIPVAREKKMMQMEKGIQQQGRLGNVMGFTCSKRNVRADKRN